MEGLATHPGEQHWGLGTPRTVEYGYTNPLQEQQLGGGALGITSCPTINCLRTTFSSLLLLLLFSFLLLLLLLLQCDHKRDNYQEEDSRPSHFPNGVVEKQRMREREIEIERERERRKREKLQDDTSFKSHQMLPSGMPVSQLSHNAY